MEYKNKILMIILSYFLILPLISAQDYSWEVYLSKDMYLIEEPVEIIVNIYNPNPDKLNLIVSVAFKRLGAALSTPTQIQVSLNPGETYSKVFKERMSLDGDYTAVVRIMDTQKTVLDEKNLDFSVRLYECVIDGICQPIENYGNCPLDCPSGVNDNYCDEVEDGICDPDCPPEEDVDCGALTGIKPNVWLIVLGILILAGLVILYLFYKKLKV